MASQVTFYTKPQSIGEWISKGFCKEESSGLGSFVYRNVLQVAAVIVGFGATAVFLHELYHRVVKGGKSATPTHKQFRALFIGSAFGAFSSFVFFGPKALVAPGLSSLVLLGLYSRVHFPK